MQEQHPTCSLARQWVLGLSVVFSLVLAGLVVTVPIQLVSYVLPKEGPSALLGGAMVVAYLLLGVPVILYRLAFVYRRRIEGLLREGSV